MLATQRPAAFTAAGARLRKSHAMAHPAASVTVAWTKYESAIEPPHIRTQASVLCTLYQPTSPLSSNATRATLEDAKNALQLSGPNAASVASVRRAAVAIAAAIVRQRPVTSSASGIISPNCGL